MVISFSFSCRIKFNHGSYLYTFASDAFTPGVVDENFECEWAEVAVDNSFKENETTAVIIFQFFSRFAEKELNEI